MVELRLFGNPFLSPELSVHIDNELPCRGVWRRAIVQRHDGRMARKRPRSISSHIIRLLGHCINDIIAESIRLDLFSKRVHPGEELVFPVVHWQLRRRDGFRCDLSEIQPVDIGRYYIGIVVGQFDQP